MSSCPRCHQPVSAGAINCPHCGNTLKAFGHQGIPLYQAQEDEYLCDRCLYHEDDTCTFPQRPYAKTCTLYRDKFQAAEEINFSKSYSGGIKTLTAWCKRNKVLLIIFGLLVVSFLFAL